MPLRVVNASRGTVLADRAGWARSFGARLKGLLGRSSLGPGEGLLIEPCDAIHMFFMRFPIDALFLDADRRVVRLYPRLPPWSATSRVREARSVLELPAGAGEASGTRPGDLLRLEGS
ncbi:MAG TPA: DUF192 domain-containing protein [Myxococcales bacterium]|nr:DUF192 domain-containing protein [Myxococcales bacterium]